MQLYISFNHHLPHENVMKFLNLIQGNHEHLNILNLKFLSSCLSVLIVIVPHLSVSQLSVSQMLVSQLSVSHLSVSQLFDCVSCQCPSWSVPHVSVPCSCHFPSCPSIPVVCVPIDVEQFLAATSSSRNTP